MIEGLAAVEELAEAYQPDVLLPAQQPRRRPAMRRALGLGHAAQHRGSTRAVRRSSALGEEESSR